MGSTHLSLSAIPSPERLPPNRCIAHLQNPVVESGNCHMPSTWIGHVQYSVRLTCRQGFPFLQRKGIRESDCVSSGILTELPEQPFGLHTLNIAAHAAGLSLDMIAQSRVHLRQPGYEFVP